MSKLTSKTFTLTGNWLAPSGVSTVFIYGWGGSDGSENNSTRQLTVMGIE